MAFWINSSNENRVDLKEFYCDSEKDIINLPAKEKGKGGLNDTDNERCDIGSTCFVIDACKLYILNSNRIWVEVGGES